MNSEDREFFEELLSDKNYPGAAQFLKEISIPQARKSAYMGKIIGLVINDLSQSRSKSDRERVVYLRSLLAWLLKDYPGLASIYREQLRLANGGTDVLPEFARGVRNMGDVFSGKKTVQEGVEDAAEPLEGFAERAGDFIKDGLNQVGDFFAGLNEQSRRSSTGGGSKTSSETDSKNRPDDDDDEDSQTVNITIEDADEPLPHDIHDADKD